MSDLEKFANDETNRLPDLLKIALIHYQFETIHPFLDGNGRIGRLLISLLLVSKKLLRHPILYLSDFFERHRTLYYDNLTVVRTQNDINQWFKFFLTGVIEISEKGIATFEGIFNLQKTLNDRIFALRLRASDADKVINRLYKNPVIDAEETGKIIGKTPKSAYKLIAEMEKIGILKEITGGQRGRLYIFHEYIDLF
jgi:Fic family protein